MRIKTKKLIAMLMALVMLLSLMPVSVFAEGDEQPEAEPVEEIVEVPQEIPVEVLEETKKEIVETSSVETPAEPETVKEVQEETPAETEAVKETTGADDEPKVENSDQFANNQETGTLGESTIIRTTPKVDDFTVTPPNDLNYDGQAKVATVTSSKEGMGTITVKYSSDNGANWSENAPINAGTYKVAIDVEEGTNFNTVSDLTCDNWTFTILKATPTVDDFTFTQPENLTYDGKPKAATVTVKDGITGMGNITMEYQYGKGSEEWKMEAPVAAGDYDVFITVAEGDNYAAVTNRLTDDSWSFIVESSPSFVAKIDAIGYATLAEAFEALQTGDTLELPATELNADECSALFNACNGKTITVKGQGKDLTTLKPSITGHITSTKNVTFKDMTFVSNIAVDSYTASISGDFDNVKLVGQISTSGQTSGMNPTFKNCDFTEGTSNYNYLLWVYSGSVSCVSCNFNDGANVKAHIKLYGETGNKVSVALTDCTFEGTPTKKCNILISNLNNHSSRYPESAPLAYSADMQNCTSTYGNSFYAKEGVGSVLGYDEDCPDEADNIPANITIKNATGNEIFVYPEIKSEVVVEPVAENAFSESTLDQTERDTIVNQLIKNTVITAPEATNIDNVEGVSTLSIQLTNVAAVKVEEQVKVNSITFNVTPKRTDGKEVSEPDSPIKFRLPLTDNFTHYAKVEHSGDADRYLEVKDENGAKYCEVVADHFSLFTASPVNEVPVYVAQIGTTKYETMAEAAIAWATGGGTLTLLADVEYGNSSDQRVNLRDRNDFVLDLNGFTWNAGSENSPIDVYSWLKIMDSSTAGTGLLTCNFGYGAYGTYVVFVENNATFELKSGKIQAVGATTSGQKAGGIYVASGATANISGGEIVDNTESGNGYHYAVEYDGSGEITGGKIDGAVWAKNNQIKGGLYSAKLNKEWAIPATGYMFKNNSEDATYIYKVVEAVTSLSGSGTQADPFRINNIDDLEFFRDQVNAGNKTYSSLNVYVALEADIDLNNENWTPIGTSTTYHFDGHFDGKNHTISNLYVNTTDNNVGLFGCVSNDSNGKPAYISNLTVHNANVTGANYVGAIVGYARLMTYFDNVHVTGVIKIKATAVEAGGIFGRTETACDAKYCSVIADANSGSFIQARISGGAAAAGGIVGSNYGDGGAAKYVMVVDHCTVKNIEIKSFNRVGGIIGNIQSSANHAAKYITNNSVENVTVTVTGGTLARTDLNNSNTAQAGLIIGTAANNGNRKLQYYSNNIYSGNCQVITTANDPDVIPTALYSLWVVAAQRVEDYGLTGSSWYGTDGNANVTYASAEEIGEVLFDGTYYKTFLSAYHAEGAGKTGSSVEKPFKLMTDVGYSLVVGDMIYVDNGADASTGDAGHIFYPRTDVDGYHVKTTDISGTVKLYELEPNPDAKFVASLSINGSEVQKFVSIAAAVSAAPKDGTKSTITVLDNCTISNEITVPTGADITLELNGKNVEMVDIASKYMFIVKGGLTIQDNTDTNKDGTGNGKLYIHSNTKSIYGLLKAQDGGEIVINSGLLLAESASTDNIYGLVIGNDNANNSITANGGKVKVDLGTNTGKNSYAFWGNSGAKGSFTLNGAILEGNSTAQYIIADNSSYGAITLSLIQGKIISHGSFSTKPIDSYADKNSEGEYVGTPLTNILAEGSVIEKPDDHTRVIRKKTYVARILTLEETPVQGAEYETVVAALKAAESYTEGCIIELSSGVVATSGIDPQTNILNNVTIKGAADGTTTFKDSTFNFTGNGADWTGVTIENIIWNNSHIVFSTNSKLKDFTVKSCTFRNLSFNGESAVHVNAPCENFTYSNNLFEGSTGTNVGPVNTAVTNKKGMTGNIKITNNTIMGGTYRMRLMIAGADGIPDSFVINNNLFDTTSKGIWAYCDCNNGEVTDQCTSFVFNDNAVLVDGSIYLGPVYNTTLDYSGNYWRDGKEPDENDNPVYSGNPTEVCTSYATDYTVNANGRGVTVTTTPMTKSVAKIGENKYETLEAAFAAINDGTASGTEITMIADYHMEGANGATLNHGKTAVLDLNGFDIIADFYNIAKDETVKACSIINNNGDLTIKDSSGVNNDGQDCGQMILNSIAVEGHWPKPNVATNVISNNGKVTIQGGYFENKGSNYCCYVIDSMTQQHWWDCDTVISGGYLYGHYIAVRINNGNINAIQENKPHDNLTVTGGTLKGLASVWAQFPSRNYSTPIEVNITGGTFDGDVDLDADYDVPAEISISSGTFNGDIILYSATASISDGIFRGLIDADSTKFITGGTFNDEPHKCVWGYVYLDGDNVYEEDQDYQKADKFDAPWDSKAYWESNGYSFEKDTYCYAVDEYVVTYYAGLDDYYIADGYMKTKSTVITDGQYVDIVQKIDEESVAQIGDTQYETLAEAVEAAQNGDKIELLANIELTETVSVAKQITLDLGTFSITPAANGLTANAKGTKDALIAVNYGGDLTITGTTGKISSNNIASVYAAVKMTEKGEIAGEEPARLTVNGGTLEGYNYGITGNGNRHNTEVTINGGVIRGTATDDSAGIFNPQNGSLAVNGGTIEGASGIYVKAGTVTVFTGGTIKGVGTDKTFVHYGNGFYPTGAAFVVENCGYPGGTPNVAISGSTFLATNGAAVESYGYDSYPKLTGFITGGFFSSDVQSLVATGHKTYKLSEQQLWTVGVDDQTQKAEIPSDTELQNAVKVEEGTTEITADQAKEKVKNTIENNTAVNSFVNSDIKAATTSNTSSGTANLDKVKEALSQVATKDTAKTAINNLTNDVDLSSYIKVKTEAATVANFTVHSATTVTGTTVTSMTFDVKPYAEITVKEGETVVETVTAVIPNDAITNPITFRLPVEDSVPTGTVVKVYHSETAVTDQNKGNFFGNYKVQEEDGKKFIELASNHFSYFTYELTEDVIGSASYTATLNLADSIGIIMYVNNPTGTLDKYTVKATYKGVSTSTTLSESLKAAEGKYKILIADCAAAEMFETVHVVVTYDGINIKEFDYSVYDYCNNKINSSGTAANLKELCRAALDYGYYARTFFEYTETVPACSGYSPRSVSGVTVSGQSASKSGLCTGIQSVSATLSLESRTKIIFYLMPDTGYTQDSYTYSVSGGDLQNVQPAVTLGSDGRIRVEVLGIAAAKLGEVYTLTVTPTSDGGSMTVNYSPMTYAVSKQTSSTAELPNLVKSLYVYYQKASAFFVN